MNEKKITKLIVACYVIAVVAAVGTDIKNNLKTRKVRAKNKAETDQVLAKLYAIKIITTKAQNGDYASDPGTESMRIDYEFYKIEYFEKN